MNFKVFFVILFMVIIMKRKKIFTSLIASTIIASQIFTFDVTNAKVVSFLYGVEIDSLFNMVRDTGATYEYYYDNVTRDDIGIQLYEELIPQGITVFDDYILTSAYDARKDVNSTIYVLDTNGELLNTCRLDNKAHVGGIAYDKQNNLIWVASSYGCVDAFNPIDILNKKDAKPLYDNIDLGEGLKNYQNPFINSVSYLTIYNNYLYVGSFSLQEDGLVKKYSISIDDKTSDMTLKLVNSFNVPTKVQGLSFYKKDGQEYIIFSRSYGKYVPSVLQIFKYDESITSYNNEIPSISYEAPSMMEQITVLDDVIYSIFESGAKEYRYGLDSVKNIHELDAPEMVRKLK